MNELIQKLTEEANRIGKIDPAMHDLILLADVQKALAQFSANIERAIADVERRKLNDQLFF